MAGDVHCQFQPSPDSKFVKYAAQMILDYLFAAPDDPANFAIGQALPNQNRNLIFPWAEIRTRGHDCTFVFVSIASQLHTFPPLSDSGTRKQHAQVLFYSSQTDM
jgi:hypothetical protein